jgi:hypothetical protein
MDVQPVCSKELNVIVALKVLKVGNRTIKKLRDEMLDVLNEFL